MTPERRAEIRALADAASEGPWWNDEWYCCKPPAPECPQRGLAFTRGVMREGGDGTDFYVGVAGGPHADAAFIAAARSAVPELLDEIDRLRAGIQRLADRTWNAGRPRPGVKAHEFARALLDGAEQGQQ